MSAGPSITPTAAKIREHLKARGSSAKCPAHEDGTASLSINEGEDGKALLNCHAGCSQAAVIAALQEQGVWPKASGLTVQCLAAAKKLPQTLLNASGFADDEISGRSVVRIDYRDADGKVTCVRYRGSGDGSRFWFRKGDKQQLYGLWRLRAEDVIVVEGETDAVALWTQNYNAIGVPGADAWHDDRFAPLLANCPVINVHIEPDVGGEKFRAAFERSSLRDRVRFFTVPDAKDPCELHSRDPDGFCVKLEAAIDSAQSATTQSIQPAATVIPPLALLWFATLHELVHQDHLVKNLLIAGSLAVIYGDSNSGKTFFAIDLVLAIAAGIPWRGRRTKRGLVIYIAGEGAASVRCRVAAYRLAHPEIAADLPFAIIPLAVDFLSSEGVGLLVETIKEAEKQCGVKVVIVVIDTFARAMPGGDENSAQDVGQAVASADFVRTQTGACVTFVHHSGKDPTKGARGSSALRAAVDTEIMIDGQTGQRTATLSKQRDLQTGESMPFELVPVQIGFDPDDHTFITSCVVKHLEAGATTSAKVKALRGKAQLAIVNALRARTKSDLQRVWTLSELREVGKELLLKKSTYISAVDVIAGSPYMQQTIGGYRFTDGQEPAA